MTNKWSRVKIGNGGLIIGQCVAPDNTRVLWTDSSGCHIWSDAKNQNVQLFARSRMPAAITDEGDGVECCSIAPSDSNQIWMHKNGRLFKSTDRGQKFAQTPFNSGDPRDGGSWFFNNATNVKSYGPYDGIDPANPNVGYFSTNARGIQRTTDGGLSFATVAALSGALPSKVYGSTDAAPQAGTDSTAVAIGTGSHIFSTNSAAFGFAVGASNFVKVWSGADPANQMIGAVTASSGTSFTLNVDTAFGSGTFSDWHVSALITGDEGSCHCGGHRVAFDTSSGTVIAFGQPVTKRVIIHTWHVGTWESNDGGVTWTRWTATGGPGSILKWDIDPFGVIWACGGDFQSDYTNYPNMYRYDHGVWTHFLATTGGVVPAGGTVWYTSVAVDFLNSPSKAATKVTFGMGDNLWTMTTANGGTSWYLGGDQANRVFDTLPGDDVTWLLDYFTANPAAFFALTDMKYDRSVSGKCWLASEGPWYCSPPTSTSPSLALHQQARGIEEFIPTHIVCPQTGVLYVGSWDFAFFRTSNFNAYPSAIGGPFGHTQGSLSSALTIGYSLDYNANVMAFAVGQSDGGINDAINKVAYSTDYGATVTVFPTQPYVGMRAATQIACSNDGVTFVVVPPENVAKPKITTDRGNTWNNISLPGGFPGSEYWGLTAYYLAEARAVESDKATGDIYLYCTNDGAGNDPMYKWTKSTGLWTVANTHCGFSLAYILEQLKSVPGHAGHMFMVGGDMVSGSPGYCTTDGWQSHFTIAGFTAMKTVGFTPPLAGMSYPTIMAYGTRSGVTGYWQCVDFVPTTGNGTWAAVASPEDLAIPKEIAGDIALPGQFYSWTTYGLSSYSPIGSSPNSFSFKLRMQLVHIAGSYSVTVTEGTSAGDVVNGNNLGSGALKGTYTYGVWQTLRIGGGGLISGHDINPIDGTLLLRTDTYGGYVWDPTLSIGGSSGAFQQVVTQSSMSQTRNFGWLPATGPAQQQLAGGGVQEICSAPSYSSVIYMAFSGYIFASSNKGVNWSRTTPLLTTTAAAAAAVGATTISVASYPLLSGSQGVGLTSLTNTASLPAGEFEAHGSTYGTGGASSTLALNFPVAAAINVGDTIGFTINMGANQKQRYCGRKMAVDPANTQVVYYGSDQNGMFATSDGGATWTHVSAVPNAQGWQGNTSVNGDWGSYNIAFDPASGTTGGKTNTIYAFSYLWDSVNSVPSGQLWASTDAGATWHQITGAPTSCSHLVVSKTGGYLWLVDASNGFDSGYLWRYSAGTWHTYMSVVASTQVATNGTGGVDGTAVYQVVGGTGTAATLNCTWSAGSLTINSIANAGNYSSFPPAGAGLTYVSGTATGWTGATVNLTPVWGDQTRWSAVAVHPLNADVVMVSNGNSAISYNGTAADPTAVSFSGSIVPAYHGGFVPYLATFSGGGCQDIQFDPTVTAYPYRAFAGSGQGIWSISVPSAAPSTAFDWTCVSQGTEQQVATCGVVLNGNFYVTVEDNGGMLVTPGTIPSQMNSPAYNAAWLTDGMSVDWTPADSNKAVGAFYDKEHYIVTLGYTADAGSTWFPFNSWHADVDQSQITNFGGGLGNIAVAAPSGSTTLTFTSLPAQICVGQTIMNTWIGGIRNENDGWVTTVTAFDLTAKTITLSRPTDKAYAVGQAGFLLAMIQVTVPSTSGLTTWANGSGSILKALFYGPNHSGGVDFDTSVTTAYYYALVVDATTVRLVGTPEYGAGLNTAGYRVQLSVDTNPLTDSRGTYGNCITAIGADTAGQIQITVAPFANNGGIGVTRLIKIYGVQGTTEANGLWITDRMGTTGNTVVLFGSKYTNAYTSGGSLLTHGFAGGCIAVDAAGSALLWMSAYQEHPYRSADFGLTWNKVLAPGMNATDAITSATWASGTLTVGTNIPHNLVVGDTFTVQNSQPAGIIDGSYTCATGTTGSTLVASKAGSGTITTLGNLASPFWFNSPWVMAKQCCADRVTPDTFYAVSAGTQALYQIQNGVVTVLAKNFANAGLYSYYTTMQGVPGHAGEFFMSPGSVGDGTQAHPAGTNLMKYKVGTGFTTTAIREPRVFDIGAQAPDGTYPTIVVTGWYDTAGGTNFEYGVWYSKDGGTTFTLSTQYPVGSEDNPTFISCSQTKWDAWFIGFSGSSVAFNPGN